MYSIDLPHDESGEPLANAYIGYTIVEHHERVEEHLSVLDKQLEPFGLEIETMYTGGTFTAYRIVTRK